MKTIKKILFPLLLLLTCVTLHIWQHHLVNLTYLPYNEVLPLAILTPLLLLLAFLTTFTLIKRTNTPKPAVRAVISTATLLMPIIFVGLHLINYCANRFAATFPVYPWPSIPTSLAVLITTAMCLIHLTALMIVGLIKTKTKPWHAVCVSFGWLAVNATLLIIAL